MCPFGSAILAFDRIADGPAAVHKRPDWLRGSRDVPEHSSRGYLRSIFVGFYSRLALPTLRSPLHPGQVNCCCRKVFNMTPGGPKGYGGPFATRQASLQGINQYCSELQTVAVLQRYVRSSVVIGDEKLALNKRLLRSRLKVSPRQYVEDLGNSIVHDAPRL